MAAIHAWDGADWTTGDVTGIATWDGSAWQAVTSANYWDGSAWVKFWPADTPVTPEFVAAAMGSGSASSLAVSVPTGTEDGDEMLGIVITAALSGTPADPSGWAELDTGSVSGAQAISSRRAASSEPSSYTWTNLGGFNSGTRGVIGTWRGYGAAYASSLAVELGDFGAPTPTASSINVTGANDIVVAVGIGTGTDTPGTPSGFSSVYSAQGVRIATATPGVGATGSVSFTGFSSGSAAAAALFAMSPS